jgi:membrane protein YdbS with pleckstrin-like domain/phage FluMu protein Com
MPTVSCSSCSKTLRIPDKYAGMKVKCPACKEVIHVPVEVSEPVPEQIDETVPHDNEPYDDEESYDDDEDQQDEFSDLIGDALYPDSETPDDYSVSPPPLRTRTSNLVADLKEELVPRSKIPREVSRLTSKDDVILFAGNPSRAALYIRLVITGIFGLPVLWFSAGLFSIFVHLVLGLGSLPLGFFWVLVFALWIGMLYLTYVSWKTQFFCITNRQVMVRTGWFAHRIGVAPVHNIQMVNINSGLIDRWLSLNSICFETAAAAGFGHLRSGILQFANVDSDYVMRAFSVALKDAKK